MVDYSQGNDFDLVLIVPSGIETRILDENEPLTDGVLIVPSGIETCSDHLSYNISYVLIVPSGIETPFFRLGRNRLFVLIVPSGIETR